MKLNDAYMKYVILFRMIAYLSMSFLSGSTLFSSVRYSTRRKIASYRNAFAHLERTACNRKKKKKCVCYGIFEQNLTEGNTCN